MKTKFTYLFAFLILVGVLFTSCSKSTSDTPDINKAVWDLYPDMSFNELISTVLESQQKFLKTGENEVYTSHTLSEGWVQTERYTFDGYTSKKSNQPYTLTMNIASKSTEGEKEITNNITSYIFLEHNPDTNTLSICGAFNETVKTNGYYETIVLSTLPPPLAENELIVMLENNSTQNPPEKRVVPDGIEVKTATRRYIRKPANPDEMKLAEFDGVTLMEILSRFDDAFGEIMSTMPSDTPAKEYTLVSFDCYNEYDWLRSKTLNEFTDGTDITQPYTYSAVYTAEDGDGVSLVARLDIFAEIEPRHSGFSIKESVFTITYANEVIFEDVLDKDETLVLLDTIMMYHPEDVIVTPSPEESEEQTTETEANNTSEIDA